MRPPPFGTYIITQPAGKIKKKLAVLKFSVDNLAQLCYDIAELKKQGRWLWVTTTKEKALKVLGDYLDSASPAKRKEMLAWLEGFAYRSNSDSAVAKAKEQHKGAS